MRYITKLSKEKVYQLYVVDGHSDREISLLYGVVRTAVVNFRKYHHIQARKSAGEIGEKKTITELRKRGFAVCNMNLLSKTYPYDLLIDGSVRIDVKTSAFRHDGWTFTLANKPECQILESESCIKLDNGRTRKIFSAYCDFVVLCCFKNQECDFFIIPSDAIPDHQQTIHITASGKGKWWEYHNQFSLLSSHHNIQYHTTPPPQHIVNPRKQNQGKTQLLFSFDTSGQTS